MCPVVFFNAYLRVIGPIRMDRKQTRWHHLKENFRKRFSFLFFSFVIFDVEPTTFVVLLGLCMMVCVQAHTIIHNSKAFGSVLHRELSITSLCSAALLT